MGLGLSICKSIIEAHGGQLTVASREPRGAVFRVELPRHRHARKSACMIKHGHRLKEKN